MNRDDVIRMAWDAGVWIPMGSEREKCVDTLQRLAHLVAAAEREACAAICEHGWKTGIGEKHQGDVFATAIRIRGDQ